MTSISDNTRSHRFILTSKRSVDFRTIEKVKSESFIPSFTSRANFQLALPVQNKLSPRFNMISPCVFEWDSERLVPHSQILQKFKLKTIGSRTEKKQELGPYNFQLNAPYNFQFQYQTPPPQVRNRHIKQASEHTGIQGEKRLPKIEHSSRRASFKESYPKRLQKYLYYDHKPKATHVVTEQVENISRLDRWDNGDLNELSFLS